MDEFPEENRTSTLLQIYCTKVLVKYLSFQVKGRELAVAEKALHGGRIKNSHLKTSVVNINRKRDQLQVLYTGDIVH